MPNNKIISYELFLELGIDIPSKQSEVVNNLSIDVLENSQEEIFQSLLLFLELQDESVIYSDILAKFNASLVSNDESSLRYKWSGYSQSAYIKSFGEFVITIFNFSFF